jgi:hypothetical protein
MNFPLTNTCSPETAFLQMAATKIIPTARSGRETHTHPRLALSAKSPESAKHPPHS